MKSCLVLIFALAAVSCTFYGITNDLDKLSIRQKERIVKLTSFDNLDHENIYELNASTLKNEMAKYPKSLVYVFTNGCTSDGCLPLANYLAYAKEHNCQLYLIMAGYAHLNETVSQNVEAPIFAIDADYYGSNKKRNYVRYFKNELEGLPTTSKRKNYKGGLYFFEGDRLVNVSRELPETFPQDVERSF